MTQISIANPTRHDISSGTDQTVSTRAINSKYAARGPINAVDQEMLDVLNKRTDAMPLAVMRNLGLVLEVSSNADVRRAGTNLLADYQRDMEERAENRAYLDTLLPEYLHGRTDLQDSLAKFLRQGLSRGELHNLYAELTPCDRLDLTVELLALRGDSKVRHMAADLLSVMRDDSVTRPLVDKIRNLVLDQSAPPNYIHSMLTVLERNGRSDDWVAVGQIFDRETPLYTVDGALLHWKKLKDLDVHNSMIERLSAVFLNDERAIEFGVGIKVIAGLYEREHGSGLSAEMKRLALMVSRMTLRKECDKPISESQPRELLQAAVLISKYGTPQGDDKLILREFAERWPDKKQLAEHGLPTQPNRKKWLGFFSLQ